MSIELSKDVRKQAIESIERYLRQDAEAPIGNIAAAALLDYFIQEIGPLIYNRAVADTQERMQMRVQDLDIELHEEEFQYWRKPDRSRG